MNELNDLKRCLGTSAWEKGNIRRFTWRLELVYQYKLYFDRVAKFSREQLDFINALLNPGKMQLLACRYHLAIVDAVKLVEVSERSIRTERLAAELAQSCHMTEPSLRVDDRRRSNRRNNAMSTFVRRVFKLRRGVGGPATKSFLLRQRYNIKLVDAILALPAERRMRRRRKNS